MNPTVTFERVLLIGGCGFLGKHLLADLARSHPEAKIFVADVAISAKFQTSSVVYHQTDITDATQVENLFSVVKPTVVFHSASPRPFSHPLSLYMKVNYDGTRNILSAAAAAGTQALVYTSSSSVIHDSVIDLDNVDETMRVLFMPEQKEPYLHSKAMAETAVLQANRAQGVLRTAALRPSSTFGPGDEQGTSSVIDSARTGRLRWQIGDNKNLFDWTYIENNARAHVLAAERLLSSHAEQTPVDKRVDGEAFFITNGQPLPFWDFSRELGAAAGYQAPEKITVIPKTVAFVIVKLFEWSYWLLTLGKNTRINWKNMRYSTQTRVFDITKARQRLGYKAEIDIHEGIRRAAAPAREAAKP